MSYLLRVPGMHRCSCGWEGKPQRDKKARKPVDKCPLCKGETALIPLREIPGYCFCCASGRGKLLIIDHTMIRECRQCGARLNLHTVRPWIWEVTGMEQAVEKLKTEMEANKENGMVQQVGNYLLQVIAVNPAAVEKVLTADKTIVKSCSAMTAAITGKGQNYCSDEEGYSEVRKYFGIQGEAVSAPAVSPAPAAPVLPAPVTPPPAIGLDISDLFGDL